MIEMTEKILTYDELGITSRDLFLQMGYGEAEADAATMAEAEAVVASVRQWLQARFCFFATPALPTAFDMGHTILQQLHGSQAFACFIATAGTEYGSFLQQLTTQGDMVRTFIADALGSVIAEKAADQMEVHLQQSIDKLHWQRTNRFSPGYCGWHVSQQQLLFPLFDGQTCGVTLTDSSLMLPIKSVSGIIGLGKDVRRLEYPCGLCDNKHCYKRRKDKVRKATPVQS